MGRIHCCSGLHKCRVYRIEPGDGYFVVALKFLKCCPVCGNTVLLLCRLDYKQEYSEIRNTNRKAEIFFEKLKPYVMYELGREFRANLPNVRVPLNYSEFGVKKKCYSNLSSLSVGLFESLDLPAKSLEKVFL